MVSGENNPIQFSPINIGDRNAFNQIFHHYYAPLCFFAENITGSHDDAEDIVEELFVKLWNRQEQFDNDRHLKAFLYRSTKNACIDFFKAADRAGERNLFYANEQGDIEESYLHDIIRSEVIREVYQAIQDLPTQCGKVITMSYVDGLSNQEIADALDINMQTVKNHKGRGLAILKSRLPQDKFILLLLIPYIHLLEPFHNN